MYTRGADVAVTGPHSDLHKLTSTSAGFFRTLLDVYLKLHLSRPRGWK